VFHIVIPQHQKTYQNSLEYHMQSTDVDYIHNSYSRNSGYPAKFYHRQSNFNQYTMIKINEKKEKLNKYKNIKLHTSTSF